MYMATKPLHKPHSMMTFKGSVAKFFSRLTKVYFRLIRTEMDKIKYERKEMICILVEREREILTDYVKSVSSVQCLYMSESCIFILSCMCVCWGKVLSTYLEGDCTYKG